MAGLSGDGHGALSASTMFPYGSTRRETGFGESHACRLELSQAGSFRRVVCMVLSRQRNLLIAAAALATIVAGFRGTFADLPSASPSVRSFERADQGGSREDDSGTLEESVEEDDREDEQGGANLHLCSSSAPGCPCVDAARSPAHAVRGVNGEWHPIATLVHGPPSAS